MSLSSFGLLVTNWLKVVGRPLVDDTILINYLTNRYQVSCMSYSFGSFRFVFAKPLTTPGSQ